MAPSVLAGRIRQITLVSLSPWQAIVIVVAEDGQVVNRTVTFADEVSADELASAQNLLNRVLAGHWPATKAAPWTPARWRPSATRSCSSSSTRP